MNPAEARWQRTRDALRAEVTGRPHVNCRIPGWEPVDLPMGLRWLQSTIYAGFSVAHRVTDGDDGATVWFKRWEYGEPEPAWPDPAA